jgi:hypothetical protein
VQPLESLTPVLREPYLPGKKALALELLPKLKAIFMAMYFGFDHLVWFGSVGLIKDKALLERCGGIMCACTSIQPPSLHCHDCAAFQHAAVICTCVKPCM